MMLNVHFVLFMIVTCGVGYVMMVAGLQKSALEWKRRRRICPSCGRHIETRVCSACTS
jgi:hypothetical protein